jgi:hypothetical protein
MIEKIRKLETRIRERCFGIMLIEAVFLILVCTAIGTTL